MSFDRPGLPHPGNKGDEVEIDDDLREEGLELTEDGELDGIDHPGSVSRGPEPNPPRRPLHASPEAEPAAQVAAEAAEGEPVDDPAHDDPAHDAG